MRQERTRKKDRKEGGEIETNRMKGGERNGREEEGKGGKERGRVIGDR